MGNKKDKETLFEMWSKVLLFFLGLNCNINDCCFLSNDQCAWPSAPPMLASELSDQGQASPGFPFFPGGICQTTSMNIKD